jgi:hypothetical protein
LAGVCQTFGPIADWHPEGLGGDGKGNIRLAAAVVAAALVFQSVAVSACCGAVGADGNTRLFWRGTDGSASLWKLDSNFNANLQVIGTSPVYGPYFGWSFQ